MLVTGILRPLPVGNESENESALFEMFFWQICFHFFCLFGALLVFCIPHLMKAIYFCHFVSSFLSPHLLRPQSSTLKMYTRISWNRSREQGEKERGVLSIFMTRGFATRFLSSIHWWCLDTANEVNNQPEQRSTFCTCRIKLGLIYTADYFILLASLLLLLLFNIIIISQVFFC